MAGTAPNGRRRVVITGVGMVSPLGNDAESTWSNLIAGESGAGPITRFDPSEYAVRFACELKDYDPTTWIDRKQARRMDTLRAVRPVGRADGRGRQRDRHRERARPRRRGHCDRHRRAHGVRGLRQTAASSEAPTGRALSPSSRSSPTWRRPGCRWSWERRGRSRPSAPPARRRTWRSGTDSTPFASAVPRSCSAEERRRPSRTSASRVSAPCARFRSATTTRKPARGRSTLAATGSSWARPRQSSCWRSSSTRALAARRSTRSCSATACPRTRLMSRSPIRAAPIRRGR